MSPRSTPASRNWSKMAAANSSALRSRRAESLARVSSSSPRNTPMETLEFPISMASSITRPSPAPHFGVSVAQPPAGRKSYLALLRKSW